MITYRTEEKEVRGQAISGTFTHYHFECIPHTHTLLKVQFHTLILVLVYDIDWYYAMQYGSSTHV